MNGSKLVVGAMVCGLVSIGTLAACSGTDDEAEVPGAELQGQPEPNTDVPPGFDAGARASSSSTSGVSSSSGSTSGVSSSSGSTSSSSGSTSSSSGTVPNPRPSWLVGYYANPGRRLNSSATEAASLTLAASGSYSYTACYSCTPSSGTWTWKDDEISFTGGTLANRTVDTSASAPNCRILNVDGNRVWRSSPVAGCPYSNTPLTGAECSVAGVYTKHEETNGSSSSYDYDHTLTLDIDHFYMYEYDTFKMLCTSSTCSTFRDDWEPEVGTWYNTPPKSTSGYSRKPATGCTPGSSSSSSSGSTSSSSSSGAPACTANVCVSQSTLNQCVNGQYQQVSCESACVQAGYDKSVGCGLGSAGKTVCLCKTCSDPCGCSDYPTGYACGANLTPKADASRLYLCGDNATAGSVSCAQGCRAGGPGEPDYCNGSANDPCMNNPYDGVVCGSNLSVPLSSTNANSLYTCKSQKTTGKVYCLNGCYAAPPGQADRCR